MFTTADPRTAAVAAAATTINKETSIPRLRRRRQRRKKYEEEEGESKKYSVRMIDDAFKKTVNKTLEAEENALKMMSVVANLDDMCTRKRMTSKKFVKEVKKRLTVVEFLDVDEITSSSATAACGIKRC